MNDETNTNAAETEAQYSIPKLCPACGEFLVKEMVDGILCWMCPNGDYGPDPV